MTIRLRRFCIATIVQVDKVQLQAESATRNECVDCTVLTGGQETTEIDMPDCLYPPNCRRHGVFIRSFIHTMRRTLD